MSTIASPRLSTTSFSTDTSRRLSLDSHIRSQATSPARPARRNKAALRDYYGLKSTAAAPADTHSGGRQPSPPVPEITQSKLDAPGFDAEAYVHDLLARESLQGLLKVESGLVNEIRALDGEKKALVYDNYSKLITATDTIRKMRTNMDPLTPTTSTLSPAIAHIAETAVSLAKSVQDRTTKGEDVSAADDAAANEKWRQRETVRWVLAAPKRLKALVEDGRNEEARKDWGEVRPLLEKWQGVPGVDEVKEDCLKVMGGEMPDNAG
ncbi:MAG: hypothetical protein LQ352_000038 [Teloschistes flavicans]|nr:MAG: hypothetical protein LQ352_000038 [Teloschistes flavicans]